MGGDGDSNHLVSGGDLEGDSDFTQPSSQPFFVFRFLFSVYHFSRRTKIEL